MYQLPYNVLNRIVQYTDRNDQVVLSQLNLELNYVVCSKLYQTIMVVDDHHNIPEAHNLLHTLILVSDLPKFTRSLNPRNFQFVDKIIINTHSAEASTLLTDLFHKLSQLWNVTNHVISFLNYDILALRLTDSLNNYLELNSIEFAEYDDADLILAQKSRKIENLRNWFMFQIEDLLVAPASDNLQRLGIYIESNHYQGNANEGYTIEKPNYTNVKRNLVGLSELFLHSALAFLKFSDLVQSLEIPQLHLRRLSITSTHRLRNDAMLNFQQMIRHFDLNNLEEFELKISCARHHECQDLCMVKFFSDWQTYNKVNGYKSNIRKLSIIHHKSLSETVQFKTVVEDYIFDLHFSNLRELYLNLSNSVRSPSPNLSINVNKVIGKLSSVPELELLHISSFMSEWIWNLPPFPNSEPLLYHDVLVNRCVCSECKITRASFAELAELDKAKNYSHKLSFSETTSQPTPLDSWIDFTRIENIKFLQYICGVMRLQEIIMERNLTSSGTMLDMVHMPSSGSCDIEPFKKLMQHSFLNEIHKDISSHLPHLKNVNYGGILIRN